MTFLAVIPARSGSKGITDKNVAQISGHPLIAWTIKAADESACLDRIVVTTDSDEIATIARDYGAETPFLRPAELAHDDTPGIVPILHAVRWLDDHGYRPEYVMGLQPTSPLRVGEDIRAAVNLLLQKEGDSLVSVTPAIHHPYWMKIIDAGGYLHDFISTTQPVTSRQDLPVVYALNGAIYAARRTLLLEQESWYVGGTLAYVMPPERSLDIDAPWDLYLAELLLRDRARIA
jgi:CMP-N,N'-diacetyllegionaminic acid synthase